MGFGAQLSKGGLNPSERAGQFRRRSRVGILFAACLVPSPHASMSCGPQALELAREANDTIKDDIWRWGAGERWWHSAVAREQAPEAAGVSCPQRPPVPRGERL